ncbi:hypothetical protein LOK46_24235 [Methylobacterium sp. NMS14P]|uniref:DUF6894 family protein n=1 Tax=unclassified Methylobacterium TaxID=2615210 RepID=UPI002358B459|nr:hypothetical protein [Methylobacterium sp. NMS14P]WCS24217.1 hypothetical protein LOK46_24235 [Methylobacterium sp. NMS14P]
MPRYFIDTSNGFKAHDEQGLVLSGPEELAMVLRQSLATVMHDEGSHGSHDEFRAIAYDEEGRHVMIATMRLTTNAPN